MKFAKRMDRLGTETAFEVLARAKNLEAQGPVDISAGPLLVIDVGLLGCRSCGGGWVPVGPLVFKTNGPGPFGRGGGFDSLPLPPPANTDENRGAER